MELPTQYCPNCEQLKAQLFSLQNKNFNLLATIGHKHPLEFLSERKREIAYRVARGELSEKIAKDLGIAVTTVKDHLTEIYKKCGVKNRAQLIIFVNEK